MITTNGKRLIHYVCRINVTSTHTCNTNRLKFRTHCDANRIIRYSLTCRMKSIGQNTKHTTPNKSRCEKKSSHWLCCVCVCVFVDETLNVCVVYICCINILLDDAVWFEWKMDQTHSIQMRTVWQCIRIKACGLPFFLPSCHFALLLESTIHVTYSPTPSSTYYLSHILNFFPYVYGVQSISVYWCLYVCVSTLLWCSNKCK